METKKCTQCDFETDNKKVFANHIRWKHKEKPFSDEALAKLRTKKVFKIKKECKCNKCEIVFEKELYEHEWKKIDRNQGGRVYCTVKCANSRYNRTQEQKDYIQQKLIEYYKNNPKFKNSPINKKFICRLCNVEFGSKTKKVHCSKKCYIESKKRKSKDLIAYRQSCKFLFSLNDFPEEFDFSLIEKYGWYSASNRGNNTSGISRDHMVSVKYGFKNNIDPKIIAHPANCRLIPHQENFKKREKCSITLEELLAKIENWNKKYGDIAQLVEHRVCNAGVVESCSTISTTTNKESA